MEITISGILIRNDYPYLINNNICPLHDKKCNTEKIIRLICNYIYDQQSYSDFVELFEDFLDLSPLSDLKKYGSAIYLINYILGKSVKSRILIDSIEKIEIEIKKISDAILLDSFNKELPPDIYGKNILKNYLDKFIKSHKEACECEYTLRFDTESVKKYGIGPRIDLVYKTLSTLSFDNCGNIEIYIHNMLGMIRRNLRRIKQVIINVELSNVPPKLKKTILEIRKKNRYDDIYYDNNNNIIDYNLYYEVDDDYDDIDCEFRYSLSSDSEIYYDSDSDIADCDIMTHCISAKNKYVYVYADEPDPKPIYKVIFVK